MPDLFISHSSADAETARALVSDFENRGITCWIAPRDIPMGSSYQGEIVAAIERCRAMLLLFSGAANTSEHVLREVELAAQSRKAVYPLRIDGAEPAGGLRYMLANKQWVERKALGNRLIETVEQLLANASSCEGAGAPPRPVAPAKPNRLPLFAGAAALVAVLAAAGLYSQLGYQIPSRPDIAAAPTSADRQKVADATPPPAAPAQAPTATPIVVPQAPPAAAPVVPPPDVASAPTAPAPTAAVPPRADAPPTQAAPPASSPQTNSPIVEARLPAERPGVPPAASAPSQISGTAPTRAEVESGRTTLFRECDKCPVMTVVPAGSNVIGSPDGEKGRGKDEGPQQTIAIRVPFAAGRTEVTFEEWFACVADGGCNAYRPGDYDWGTGTRPVINVSWNDAKAYVEWLSKKLGATYRLLSEAEWEYAARGCAKACAATPFWFGDISATRANYDWRYAYDGSPKAQPPRRTVPADSGEANPFGLLHVHGNVREWVEDCWNDSLAGLPTDGSARKSGDCRSRVLRGGSWVDEPKDLRSAKRNWEVPAERRAQNGFRVGRDLQP